MEGSQPYLPRGWYKWTFWQYSEKGVVNGINAKVDMDLFNGTLEELYKFAGAQITVDKPKTPQKHSIVAGDSFESIANKYGVTVRELISANPQLLKTGEQLTVPAAVAIGRNPVFAVLTAAWLGTRRAARSAPSQTGKRARSRPAPSAAVTSRVSRPYVPGPATR